MARGLLIAAWALALGVTAARADDTLKIAIGQINNWENQAPTLGQQAGIFKKHGLMLENFGTQGAGETLQAVISGSADIGIGVGTPGALRAFAKGAPVRVISAGFVGTGDLYWYVPANSPIKSLADATEATTIAYSTSGSTSNNIVLAFIKELGVKAKPTATGGPPPTYTQVMSGQVDIGWSAPPFGLEEIEQGRIRVIARGSDATSTRNQTVRVQIVNANALKDRRDAILRFMQAYRETIDWMYADPQAVKFYAQKIGKPESLVELSRRQFHPKEALDPDRLSDIDGVMADAVALKFLDAPLTKEQLAEFFQIPKK
ncbi:MAG TPA: ABC transporter substrate-binding protein [Xanthobacteraceae bacterium]|nr:ABC transporter substrate-binding protein [Xanthobacteraceae bacterium]